MNTENRSVLKFDNYVVKEIVYKINENFDKKEYVKLDFSFDNKLKYIPEDQRMEIELTAYVFRNACENNYPFEMKVVLSGFFEVEGEGVDIRKFEANALAILFPYMRALVSTYTSNANLAPVILPAMNINAFLKNKYNSRIEKNEK